MKFKFKLISALISTAFIAPVFAEDTSLNIIDQKTTTTQTSVLKKTDNNLKKFESLINPEQEFKISQKEREIRHKIELNKLNLTNQRVLEQIHQSKINMKVTENTSIYDKKIKVLKEKFEKEKEGIFESTKATIANLRKIVDEQKEYINNLEDKIDKENNKKKKLNDNIINSYSVTEIYGIGNFKKATLFHNQIPIEIKKGDIVDGKLKIININENNVLVSVKGHKKTLYIQSVSLSESKYRTSSNISSSRNIKRIMPTEKSLNDGGSNNGMMRGMMD